MASSSWLLATADSLQKTPTAAEQAAAELAAEQRQRRDVVAEWRVATKERMHVIEFEHGTTSGKRVLWLDGKVCAHTLEVNTHNDSNPLPFLMHTLLVCQEILRREWMFKLVGDDVFELDDGVRCLIRVNPARGMKFTYALYVDGKPFEQYRERQARALITWEHCDAEDRHYRIVLGKTAEYTLSTKPHKSAIIAHREGHVEHIPEWRSARGGGRVRRRRGGWHRYAVRRGRSCVPCVGAQRPERTRWLGLQCVR